MLRKIWSSIGLSLLLMLSTIALIQAFPTKEPLSQAVRVFWGALAYLAMAVNLLLASRISIVEDIFGGLDKAYKQHRQLGILSMGAALLHFWSPPVFSSSRCIGICAEVLAPAVLAGQFALYSLLCFGAISALRRYKIAGRELPYGVWKITHWAMLAIFAAGTFHLITIPKMPLDYQNFAQVLGWIGMTCGLAYCGGHIFRRRRTFKYRVSAVERQGDITIIDAMPMGAKLQHQAGQFAFIRFDMAGLKEPHPFTISSGENEKGIQFCIKSTGDFTKRVFEDLQPETIAHIEGPYGRFAKRIAMNEHWIAAGIGITPFLSLLKSLPNGTKDTAKKASMTYIVRHEEDVIQEQVLDQAFMAGQLDHLDVYESSSRGRWKPSIGNDDVVKYCGPIILKDKISARSKKVQSEDFTFN